MSLIWSFNSNSIVIQINQNFKSNFVLIRILWITLYINFWFLQHEKYSFNIMSIERTFNSFDMRDKWLKSTVLWLFFISFVSFNIGYFVQPCNIACSMHFWPLWHTPDLAKLAFSTYQFLVGRFLNISNHLPDSWPEAHLHNWPIWPN